MERTEQRATVSGSQQTDLPAAQQHADKTNQCWETPSSRHGPEFNVSKQEIYARNQIRGADMLCLGENHEPESGAEPATSFNADRSLTAVRRNARNGASCPGETQQSVAFRNQLTTATRLDLLKWQLSAHRPLPQGPSRFSCLARSIRSQLGSGPVILQWGKCDFVHLDLDGVLNAVNRENSVLETRTYSDAKYTVLGFIQPETYYIDYRWRENVLQHGRVGQPVHSESSASASATCELLQEVLHLHMPQNKEQESPLDHAGERGAGSGFDNRLTKGHLLPSLSPFWGGWISYHAAVVAGDQTASFSFAFLHRSIVIDHGAKTAYVQSLLPADWSWILATVAILDGIACKSKV